MDKLSVQQPEELDPERLQDEQLSAEQLNQAIAVSDMYIRKEYLPALANAELVPLDQWRMKIQPGTNQRLIHLTSLTLEDRDTLSQRLADVYQSVAAFDARAFLLLDGRDHKVNIYLGVATEGTQRLPMIYRTFLSSFTGSFPGCQFKNVKEQESCALMESLFSDDLACISAVSVGANVSSQAQAQGLERIIDGMTGRPFAMLLTGSTLSHDSLVLMRKGYEALYTQLSLFEKQTVTKSWSEAVNFSVTTSQAISEALNYSSGTNWNVTHTEGITETDQATKGGEENAQRQSAAQIAGVAATLLMTAVNPAAGGGSLLQNLFFSQSVGGVLGHIDRLSGEYETPETHSTAKNTADAEGHGGQTNIGGNISNTKTDGQTSGVSDTQGKTFQVTLTRKAISDLLVLIDQQIQRLHEVESCGGFETCAYFLAGDQASGVSAASLFRSICGAGEAGIEVNPVLTWDKPEAVRGIGEYLSRCLHPAFRVHELDNCPVLSPASALTIKEFSRTAVLPQRSLPGFSVTRHAQFARDVIVRQNDQRQDSSLMAGHIYHMGRTEQAAVPLDKESLTRHMFVTGTTGGGKSNFCYEMIQQLAQSGVHVMVIEPAKGEYAQVFGGREDFSVFGTNGHFAPILRINPFAFPAGIHVLEHIDRLISIFNASWPMYAAMPAILKEALELCYEKMGFDLESGDLPEGGHFPTFADLLAALPSVIDQSDYSGEVKGNYRGALLSRVRSMTNGLYGKIWSEDEIDNSILFDENVLVDISRAGSAETKALIMGVLVMRLSEYRMCSGRMNAQLHHVTILEEAHHLLRRQNQASAEGVSLAAASAEMIVNAISEMRSAGEGFVIADQSPALMDQGVIRNTNTKVAFCLHEREDCDIIGNALALNEAQKNELARLPTGVAAIYQNNWTDTVLCKTLYFDMADRCPFQYTPEKAQFAQRMVYGQILSLLVRKDVADCSFDVELFTKMREEASLYPKKLRQLIEEAQDYACVESPSRVLSADLLDRSVNLSPVWDIAAETADTAEWAGWAREYIAQYAELSQPESDAVLTLGLSRAIQHRPDLRKLYFRFVSYCKLGTVAV